MAIAKIASIFVPAKSETAEFVQEVTGTALSLEGGVKTAVQGGLSAYTKWQTWAKFLIPPLPFPGGQGSVAIGSPNVQVNGGPLGFVAPLMSVSCTDFIWVPNAATISFSNVRVGVSVVAMVRAIGVHAAQTGISKAVAHGVGKLSCGCNK
jgi:hypothetical protein